MLKHFYSFLRVEEYIARGKDKNIVDPDPNQLYTKRKQQRSGALSGSSNERPSQGNNCQIIVLPVI